MEQRIATPPPPVNPMSAREAWEIVKGGVRGRTVESPEERARETRDWVCYARACAIVEARIAECEAREAQLEHDKLEPSRNAGSWYTKAAPLALALTEATKRARALERGEEGK